MQKKQSIRPVHLFHTSRVMLVGLLVLAAVIARTNLTSNSLTYDKQAVLAYATSMSIADLFSNANASRAANGLAPLSLNAQLNSSAQMKANDMIQQNYWSHVSPTGVQPWYWFNQAGYSYSAAGENLAYGFNTGAEVNVAWMNSPSHKANILGDFSEVGFGIANGPSYQGGANTVVVAHYGKPPTPTPAATPAPAAPVTPPTPPTPRPATTPTTPATPATSSTPTPPTPTPAPTPVAESDKKELKAAEKPTPQKAQSSVVSSIPADKPKTVSAFEAIRAGKTPVFIIASIGLVTIAAGGFALTHRTFMKHLVSEGRHFIAHHPLLDATLLLGVVAVILSTSVGHLI